MSLGWLVLPPLRNLSGSDRQSDVGFLDALNFIVTGYRRNVRLPSGHIATATCRLGPNDALRENYGKLGVRVNWSANKFRSLSYSRYTQHVTPSTWLCGRILRYVAATACRWAERRHVRQLEDRVHPAQVVSCPSEVFSKVFEQYNKYRWMKHIYIYDTAEKGCSGHMFWAYLETRVCRLGPNYGLCSRRGLSENITVGFVPTGDGFEEFRAKS